MSRRDFRIRISFGTGPMEPSTAADACRQCVFHLESMFLLLTLLDPQKLGRESEGYAGEDLATAFRNFGELGVVLTSEAAALLELAESGITVPAKGHAA